MQHTVAVAGHEFVVDRPYSSRPRVSVDGRPLPTGRRGRAVFTDAAGADHPVAVSFDMRALAPQLRVGDQRLHTVRPLPVVVRVVLLTVVVVGFFGGALGAALAVGAACGSAALLRHPRRHAGHVVGAVLLPFAALLAYGVGVVAMTLLTGDVAP